MLAIVVIMVLTVVVSAVVIMYVAYPHRGEDLPVAPAIGDVMRKGVDALPTIGGHEGEHWSPLTPRVPAQGTASHDQASEASHRA